MTVKLQYRLHLILLVIPGLYCQASNTSHQLRRLQSEWPRVLWFFQLKMWTVFIRLPMINCNSMFCGFIWLFYIEFSKLVIVVQTSSSPHYCFSGFYKKSRVTYLLYKASVINENLKWICAYTQGQEISLYFSFIQVMLAITTSSMVDLSVLCHQNVEWKTMASGIFLLIQT